jgi:hypothetical protein
MWLIRPGFSGFVDLSGPKIIPESINSLFFSLIAGNSVVETGLIATASATTHSFEADDIPNAENDAAVAAFRVGALSLETAVGISTAI